MINVHLLIEDECGEGIQFDGPLSNLLKKNFQNKLNSFIEKHEPATLSVFEYYFGLTYQEFLVEDEIRNSATIYNVLKKDILSGKYKDYEEKVKSLDDNLENFLKEWGEK